MMKENVNPNNQWGKRLLDKAHIPNEKEIDLYIGENSIKLLQQLETYLQERYNLSRELKFPFGKRYGWGYKYSHKKNHLFYLFFEENRLLAMLQIGDENDVNKIENQLSEKALNHWQYRYPCGKNNGGWLHFPVESSRDLADIKLLVNAKLPIQ